MDSLNNKITIETKDNKILTVDIRIRNLVEYFNDNSSEFETKEKVRLESVSSKQMLQLVEFCESLDYKTIVLDESFCDPEKEFKKFPDKLKVFYNNLTDSQEINDLMSVASILSIPLLEEICLMKLNTEMMGNNFFEELTKQIDINKLGKNDLVNQILKETDLELFSKEEIDELNETDNICEDPAIKSFNQKSVKKRQKY